MAFKPFPTGHLVASADLNDLVGNYDRALADVDIVNTVTETAVYSHTITASHIGSQRACGSSPTT